MGKNVKPVPVNPKSEVAIRRTMQRLNKVARKQRRINKRLKAIENAEGS